MTGRIGRADSSTAKRRALYLISGAEFLGMTVWFSASAVVPALTSARNLTASGQAWLTMSVQLGFVVGAFGSALLNIADLIPSRVLFSFSALLAGGVTFFIPSAGADATVLVALRFLTGFLLAGVYPVGMKIMATWTKEDRGWGIGLLVGALTLGSATPHLLKALVDLGDWQLVLRLSGTLAAGGGFLALLFVREGPCRTPAPRFDWKYAGQIWSDRALRLVNFGYFGHMWELYAMWTWLPVFLVSSFRIHGTGERWAGLAAFSIVAAGAAGSLIAGKLADRFGRTAVTSAAMISSACCSLTVGFLYGKNPWVVLALGLIWGLTVVADSAQFSAGVSELCPADRSGTALTLQTSLGFLLTLASIRLVPALVRLVTWRWAFAFLAAGPVLGTLAMLRLRKLREAGRMAGGRK